MVEVRAKKPEQYKAKKTKGSSTPGYMFDDPATLFPNRSYLAPFPRRQPCCPPAKT
jgi:hypothetical protein